MDRDENGIFPHVVSHPVLTLSDIPCLNPIFTWIWSPLEKWDKRWMGQFIRVILFDVEEIHVQQLPTEKSITKVTFGAV